MKTLVCLLMLAMSVPLMAGPRIVGNGIDKTKVDGLGGGGVKQNGVYKTFYSAKVLIEPQAETEIPGVELYMSIIQDLTNDTATSSLIYSAIPVGDRKFYKIAEDKMEASVMNRLLEEYARVVGQSKENLTIFAITDISLQTTYLMPSFYNLSEIEQASILFHEAYWILNPSADYNEVVEAEMAFQKYAEAKAAGKYDNKLPRILGRLLKNNRLPLKAAWLEDARASKVNDFISEDETISVKKLFFNNDFCKLNPFNVTTYTHGGFFGGTVYYTYPKAVCTINKSHIQALINYSKKYPYSYFLKELLYYVTSQDGSFSVRLNDNTNNVRQLDVSDTSEKAVSKKVMDIAKKFQDQKLSSEGMIADSEIYGVNGRNSITFLIKNLIQQPKEN